MIKQNYLKIILIVSAIGLGLILIVSTSNVLSIVENPRLFSIDFQNKHQIISSYSSLIGSILTFISIILVLFSILKQNERYEEDKASQKEKDNKYLLDRAFIVRNLLTKIIKVVLDTGEEMDKFSKNEKEKPLVSNFLSFFPTTSIDRFLELNYLTNFNAIQFYVSSDIEKPFDNLYSAIDFYKGALEELKVKMEIHLKRKYEDRLALESSIKQIIALSLKTKDLFKSEPDHERDVRYNLLNNFVGFYYDYLKANEPNETDLKELSNGLFKDFIEEYLKIRKQGYDENIEEIVSKVSVLRKQINRVKVDAIDMANMINARKVKYFSNTSELFLKLDEVKKLINN